MSAAEIQRRVRAMLEWCDRVRERGGRAEIEEDEDLPCLRAEWILARAAERARHGRP
jgi:hypothetical protein